MTTKRIRIKCYDRDENEEVISFDAPEIDGDCTLSKKLTVYLLFIKQGLGGSELCCNLATEIRWYCHALLDVGIITIDQWKCIIDLLGYGGEILETDESR